MCIRDSYHSHPVGVLAVIWVLFPSADVLDPVFSAQHQLHRIQAIHGVDYVFLSTLWWPRVYGVHRSIHRSHGIQRVHPHVHFQPQCWVCVSADGLGDDFIYLEGQTH